MANAALRDMQRITRFAAEPREPGDSVKAAIGRAAKRLNLSYRRCYDFWYASSGAAVRAAEADHLRAAELRLIAAERARLKTKLDWIEARLNAREGGANDQGVGAQGGASRAQDSPTAGTAGGVAGAEGLIHDPRQRAWGW